MTFATDQGLEIGKTYVLLHEDNDIPAGTHVTFKEDDKSRCVLFDVPKDTCSSGTTYLMLDNIGAEVGETGPATFSLAVATNKTEITINRALTTAEVIALLKIIEGTK